LQGDFPCLKKDEEMKLLFFFYFFKKDEASCSEGKKRSWLNEKVAFKIAL
jgi:hypothetical protein